MPDVVETNEAQVKAMLDRSRIGSKMCRWVSCGSTKFGLRMNWVRATTCTIHQRASSRSFPPVAHHVRLVPWVRAPR